MMIMLASTKISHIILKVNKIPLYFKVNVEKRNYILNKQFVVQNIIF